MPQLTSNLRELQGSEPGLSSFSNCFRDYKLEEGLTLRQMKLNASDSELHDLLSEHIDADDYFFAYCPDKAICDQLSALDVKEGTSVKRFFFSDSGQKNSTSVKEVFVFIINSNWIKNNYNCSAEAFAAFIDMLPIVFNIADNPTLVKIDLLFHLKTIKELTKVEETALVLRLRANVLMLIEKFFSSADFIDMKAGKTNNYTKEMHDLGARLLLFLKSNLPDLIIFAKEYNMSLSSLKRHFKNVHGKPIYEFYLEEKMKLAKNIIQGSQNSVAQVAYELGYEDPNSLIKSFKKVYGVAPGKMKF